MEPESIGKRITSILGGGTEKLGSVMLALIIQSGAIRSVPPAGMYKVVNIYFDPSTGKVIVEYEGTSG